MSESQSSLLITCEKCGHQFPAEKALREQLGSKLREEAQLAVVGDLERKHQEDLKRQKETLERVAQENLAEEQRKAREATDREAEKAKRLAEEAKRHADETDQLKKEAEAGRHATLEARKKEGELAKERADMEITQEEWKAAQAKSMAQEVRAKAEALAAQRQETLKIEYDAKLQESKDQNQRMQEQIKVLSQKAQSQDNRAVGEGQELALEAMLGDRFRQDQISPVLKGERGADIIQAVHSEGRVIGNICWESKKTQVFQAAYVDKLRADMVESKSDLGVLVSVAFPASHKDDTFFSPEDRILVIRPQQAPLVAEMLRRRVIEVARQRDVSMRRPETAQRVFDQVTSPGFLEALGNMAAQIKGLQDQNESEFRVLAQIYTERQKSIVDLAGGLYVVAGMTLGAAGTSLPGSMNVMASLPKLSGTLPQAKKGKGKRGQGRQVDGFPLLGGTAEGA